MAQAISFFQFMTGQLIILPFQAFALGDDTGGNAVGMGEIEADIRIFAEGRLAVLAEDEHILGIGYIVRFEALRQQFMHMEVLIFLSS